MALNCPKCNGNNPPTAYYCSFCGAQLPMPYQEESAAGWTRRSDEECEKCGFRNVIYMTGMAAHSYCQECGTILPSEVESRKEEGERETFWKEKYAPLGIEPSQDFLVKLGRAREGALCPFCGKEFGEGEYTPAFKHDQTDLGNTVSEDFGVQGEAREALVRRLKDPIFQLKMHLILLHDNPSKIEVDRTKEEFWRDVLGFTDVQPGVSRRVLLGEIKKIWMELEASRKKEGI